MHPYERHVFVCTGGDWCPTIDGDGIGVHAALKRMAAIRGLARQVRINQSGCMSQCGHGPMVVVYPEGVWYAGVQPADADEIVDRHLVGGERVERLCYRPPGPGPNKLPRGADGRPLPPDGRPLPPDGD